MMESISFEELLARDGRLVYTNKGVSMLPLLRQNRDLMVIEKYAGQPLKRLDSVLFRRMSRDGCTPYVMHRILRVNQNGTYFIAGDNCFTGETVAERQILGVLTAVRRNGKTIRMTDFSYRLYSHLWGDCWPMRFFILRLRNFLFRYAAAAKRRLFGKQRRN